MSGNNPVSPKVTAATLGAAVTTIVFFFLSLAGVFDDVSPEALSGLTAAVTTVLTFVFGYIVRDPARTTTTAGTGPAGGQPGSGSA